MALNTYQYLILVGMLNLLIGGIVSSTTTGLNAEQIIQQNVDNRMRTAKSFADSQYDSSHLQDDLNPDQTAGNAFVMSFRLWDMLKYGFGSFLLIKSSNGLIGNLILFPGVLLNSLFLGITTILVFDKIKSRKVD